MFLRDFFPPCNNYAICWDDDITDIITIGCYVMRRRGNMESILEKKKKNFYFYINERSMKSSCSFMYEVKK